MPNVAPAVSYEGPDDDKYSADHDDEVKLERPKFKNVAFDVIHLCTLRSNQIRHRENYRDGS